MRPFKILVAASASAAIAVGVAGASHVAQVDPATVPTGFLAAHNAIENVPVHAIARAASGDGVEAYVQHARIPANGATAWHTHPGPVVVTVVSGQLTFEDAVAGVCRRRTYEAGTGFVDRGFGHVHRAVAGASTLDFYATYLLPTGSENHLILADAPAACAS